MQTCNWVLFSLAAGLALTRGAEKKPPAHWKYCKKSDPNVDSCLKTAINEALADLATNGLKEFGVLPLDPFKITELNVAQGSGPVSINLNLKNAEMTGFNACRYKTVRSNLQNHTIKGTLENVPRLNLVGDYKMSGKVLLLPISGEGRCNLTLNDVRMDVDLYGREKIKNGQKYIEVEAYKFPLVEPKAGDQMNKFLNENWRLLLKETMPALEEAFGMAFTNTANKIISKVPFDKLFLD